MADPYFQTVVKMQAPAGNIRYLPVLPSQKQHGKILRKMIAAEFRYFIFSF